MPRSFDVANALIRFVIWRVITRTTMLETTTPSADFRDLYRRAFAEYGTISFEPSARFPSLRRNMLW